MSDILKTGDYVKSQFNEYQVIRSLGDGGQGSVYLVKDADKMYALKWYNTQTATPKQYQSIEMLIEKGIQDEAFIWPLELVEGQSEDNFGYIMPLIDTKKYQKLTYLFSGEIIVEDKAVLITACLNLAKHFYELHLNGLCYRDISFGNLFVNFENGDVVICDNDNITFDNLESTDDIWGTGGFMAPELLRGESAPSTQTDLYSLAVVIFRMLYLQHPLQGQREFDVEITTFETELDLYGKNPIFIFDPIDETNRPVKGKKDAAVAFWNAYPKWFNAIMIRAFTEGLHKPNERIRETKWIEYLTGLRGQITYCYHCGKAIFYDTEKIGKWECDHCHHKIDILSPRIKIDQSVVILNHNSCLYTNQVDNKKMLSFDELAARIEVHPVHENVWGLRNLSESDWFYSTDEDEVRKVSKNGVVPLKHGRTINFGNKLGEIRLS